MTNRNILAIAVMAVSGIACLFALPVALSILWTLLPYGIEAVRRLGS